MNAPSGKIRRRRFQFSLRTLLSAVTVIIVLLAGWRTLVEPYHRQHATIAMIERMNGSEYETEAADTWFARFSPSYFRNVIRVYLFEPSDEALERVAALPKLKRLDVGQGIGDKQLRLLADTKSLVVLGVHNAPVKGPGLIYLKNLPRLSGLDLRGSQLDDGAISQLSALVELRWISLYDTRTSDATLAELKDLPQLEGLCLSGTRVGDAGLEHLKSLTQLRWLDLDDTQVTDAGLPHLEPLKNLRRLVLGPSHGRGSSISDEAVRRLELILPNCSIRN